MPKKSSPKISAPYRPTISFPLPSQTRTSKPASSCQPTRICVFCSATTGRSPAHVSAAKALAQALHTNNIQLVYGGGTTGLMGELAKTLVALSGPDAVLGVIPTGIVAAERPEDVGADKKENGVGDTAARGWWAKVHKRGQRYSSTSKQASKKKGDDGKSAAALANEAIFGRVRIVSSLSERKQTMAQLVALGGPGSGFVALSGGFGTMDETMEVATLYQYGVHKRRVCFFTVEGYWDGVDMWFQKAIVGGFVREEMKDVVGVVGDGFDGGPEGCIRWLRDGYKQEGVGG